MKNQYIILEKEGKFRIKSNEWVTWNWVKNWIGDIAEFKTLDKAEVYVYKLKKEDVQKEKEYLEWKNKKELDEANWNPIK